VITLIAEHWGDPMVVEKGMEAFRRNSEKLKGTKGFVSRSVLRSRVDPYKYTTVTTFASAEAYDEFMRALHERVTQRAREGTPPLFKGEKLEAYEVLLSD
jgi:heme-degrading monooxygenase HmoA